MTGWIARHSERLWKHREHSSVFNVSLDKPRSQKGLHRNKQVGSGGIGTTSQPTTRRGPFQDDGSGRLEEDDSSYGGEDEWQGHAWSWSGSGANWSWKSLEYEPPATWDYRRTIHTRVPCWISPPHRSGLAPAEKSNILTTIKCEFTTAVRKLFENSGVIQTWPRETSANPEVLS